MNLSNFWNTVTSGLKKVGQFFTGNTAPTTNPNGVKDASEAASKRVKTQFDNPEMVQKIKEQSGVSKEKKQETAPAAPATVEEKQAYFDTMQAPREARMQTAAEEDAARQAAYNKARNAGANRAMASAMMGATQGADSNYASNLVSNRTNNASTQADWLNKQGYAKQLEMEADNLAKNAAFNTAGAALSGAGAGATIGGRLFG